MCFLANSPSSLTFKAKVKAKWHDMLYASKHLSSLDHYITFGSTGAHIPPSPAHESTKKQLMRQYFFYFRLHVSSGAQMPNGFYEFFNNTNRKKNYVYILKAYILGSNVMNVIARFSLQCQRSNAFSAFATTFNACASVNGRLRNHFSRLRVLR